MFSRLGRLTRTEVKLGLVLIITSVLFVHWGGWAENSLFDLTRAIAERGTLVIDPDASNTGDRSVVNDHYYSNKAPGAALLAVPLYLAWKIVYTSLIAAHIDEPSGAMKSIHWPSGVPIVVDINLDAFTRIAMVIVTCLPIFLYVVTTLLIYRIAAFFTSIERHRLLVATIYAYGTLAFVYAPNFMTNVMGGFFPTAAFYCLLKRTRKTDNRLVILAGVVSGFGAVVDYSVLLCLPIILLYSVMSSKNSRLKSGLQFTLATLVGISPLLLYNMVILNTPLDLVVRYSDPAIWQAADLGFHALPNPFVLLRVLIGPYRGLFVYSPILILGIIGLHCMRRTHPLEVALIAALFLVFTLSIAMYWYWWGGYVFGQRFFLPIIPFLVLPIVFIMKRYGKVVWPLLILSFVINLAGLQQWEEKVSSVPGTGLDEAYQDRIASFAVLENPLLDHYLPLILIQGPRSRLLESLANRKLDIRNSIGSPKGDTPQRQFYLFLLEPLGFVVLKIRWLAVFLSLVAATLIWRHSLRRMLGKRVRWLWVGEGIAFFACFLGVTPIRYLSHWHGEEPFKQGTFRWMSEESSLDFYSPSDVFARLSFTAWSYRKTREIQLSVNNQQIPLTIVPKDQPVATPLIPLHKGINLIRFESSDGCESQSNDLRCRSISVANLALQTRNNILQDPMFDRNWYPEEETTSDNAFRWMSQDGIISVYESAPKKVRVMFTAWTALENKQLQLFLNEELIGSYQITPTEQQFLTPLVELELSNIFRFHVAQGCDEPEVLGIFDDTHCLALKQFSTFSLQLLANQPLFSKEWYPAEDIREMHGRWMTQKAGVLLHNADENNINRNLSFWISSYHAPWTLQVSVDGQPHYEGAIQSVGTTIVIPIVFERGSVEVVFKSKEGCIKPTTADPSSNDTRCLSFFVANLENLASSQAVAITPNEFPAQTPVALKNVPQSGKKTSRRYVPES